MKPAVARLTIVIAGAPKMTIPALCRDLPPRIPPPGLRPLWLGVSLATYRAADALDARYRLAGRVFSGRYDLKAV